MKKELTTPDVFLAKLNKNGPVCIHKEFGDIGRCWEWTGCRKDGKYGYTAVNWKNMYSHRVAWLFANGEIPPGLCVLHKCDNMICCNPFHLFLGTRKTNSDDKVKKNRQSKGRKHSIATDENRVRGESHYRARFTADDILSIREMFDSQGMSVAEIARIRGDKRGAISKIVHRVRWKHLP